MVIKNNCLWYAVFACVVMAFVDAVWQPDYHIKSAVKIVMFFVLPLIFGRKLKPLSVFSFKKKALKTSLGLGFSLFFLILCAYFLLGSFFNLSEITSVLEKSMGVTASNFGFVAIYIALVNSLLEEFFFRGFVFLKLKKKYSGIYSALLFSLYHVAMMIGWFDITLFTLVLIALFVAGLIFNKMDKKFNSIYPSYFVHLFANLAINTIGFILFSK